MGWLVHICTHWQPQGEEQVKFDVPGRSIGEVEHHAGEAAISVKPGRGCFWFKMLKDANCLHREDQNGRYS